LYCIVLYCMYFIALNLCYIQILRHSILAIINERSPGTYYKTPGHSSQLFNPYMWSASQGSKVYYFCKVFVITQPGLNPWPPSPEANTEPPSRLMRLSLKNITILSIYTHRLAHTDPKTGKIQKIYFSRTNSCTVETNTVL
jgi:hypothetical protein